MMKNSIELMPGERLDNIGFGGLLLIQEPSSFCYGIDAVLLADYAAHHVKAGGTVCDLGTGTGIIPLILSYKTEAKEIAAVEVQHDSAERAVRNVEGNGLCDRIHIVHADVADTLPLAAGRFDLVTSNPPYVKRASGLRNENDAKMTARHETSASLDDFIRTSSELLKTRGNLCMIHRPSRLVDLFTLCRKYRLEPKEMRLISPRAGEAPNLVLLRCAKGGGAELQVLEPLAVYYEDGTYTREIMEIYERTEKRTEPRR